MRVFKKAKPFGSAFKGNSQELPQIIKPDYFFLEATFLAAVFFAAGFAEAISTAAWAAARQAIGTRNGEQLT